MHDLMSARLSKVTFVKSLVNQKDSTQNAKASHRKMVGGKHNPGQAAMH